ncbi:MAG: SpoIIE family protein phosphatase [Leptospiraceae bacterium]|nr:SpoIIE family protein phosphatase [Leptospiraceae bacterium]
MFKTDRDRRFLGVLGALLIAVGIFLFVPHGGWHSFDFRFIDIIYRQALRYGQGPGVSRDILYVTVTDETYNQFNESALDRKHIADLNRVLTRYQARAVAYDLIFARKQDPETDTELAMAFAENGHVFLPVGFELKLPDKPGAPRAERTYASLHQLLKRVSGIGHVGAPSDSDGVYRHFYLLVRTADGAYTAALPFAMYLSELGLDVGDLEINWGRHIRVPTQKTGADKDLFIPIDEHGAVYIPFADFWATDFEKISLHRILETAEDPDMQGNLLSLIEGRFILVGDVSTGIADAGATPLENNVPLVALHAALLNGLLTDTFFLKRGFVAHTIVFGAYALLLCCAALLRRNRFFYIIGFLFYPLLLAGVYMEFTQQHLWSVSSLGLTMSFVFIGMSAGVNYRGYLENLRVERQNEPLMRDLEIAHNIQASILPSELPASEKLEFAATTQPARFVGGDFYDAIRFPDGRVCMVLGDVTGKGIPAALYMSGVVNSLRSVLTVHFQDPREHSLREAVLVLNEILRHGASVRERTFFATTCFVLLDPDRSRAEIIRCGHEAALVFRASEGTLRGYTPSGFVLGVMPSKMIAPRLEVLQIAFEPGDRIFLFSDGVSEAVDPDRKFYTQEKLEELLLREARQPVDTIQDRLLADLRRHSAGSPQYDDITFMAAGFRSVRFSGV